MIDSSYTLAGAQTDFAGKPSGMAKLDKYTSPEAKK